MVARVVVTIVVSTSRHSLEIVPVKMEGMPSGVIVVQHNFDDLVSLEYKRIRVAAVDHYIIRRSAGSEDRIERRHFRPHIGDVVEGSAVRVSASFPQV